MDPILNAIAWRHMVFAHTASGKILHIWSDGDSFKMQMLIGNELQYSEPVTTLREMDETGRRMQRVDSSIAKQFGKATARIAKLEGALRELENDASTDPAMRIFASHTLKYDDD